MIHDHDVGVTLKATMHVPVSDEDRIFLSFRILSMEKLEEDL